MRKEGNSAGEIQDAPTPGAGHSIIEPGSERSAAVPESRVFHGFRSSPLVSPLVLSHLL